MKSSRFTVKAPFREDFERRIYGAGKDSIVRTLPSSPDTVVKIPVFTDDTGTAEGAMNQLRYKERKYQYLKHFLGDFIPESMFVLGWKHESINHPDRLVGYTIQKKVPDFRLSSLTMEERADPKLISNVSELFSNLRDMYLALGEANARTGDDVRPIDGKLDLGGLSKLVRSNIESEYDGFEVAELLSSDSQFLNSPNICVDPDSMQIWCIDFDKGTWDEGRETAYQYITNRYIGNIAVADKV